MGELLGRYTDPAGVAHELVLIAGREGRLLVDRSRSGELVVAQLGEGEGREQALAVLNDAEVNTEGLAPKPAIVGYLARAAVTSGPLCRAVRSDDLPEAGRKRRREAA